MGLGVEDDKGGGVEDRASMAVSICLWLALGGGGICGGLGVGLAGRVLIGVGFLGVALLQSTFPRGKFSL